MRTPVAQRTAKPESLIKAQSDDCGTLDINCSILPMAAYHDTNTRRNHTSIGHPQLVEQDPCVYILHPRCYENTEITHLYLRFWLAFFTKRFILRQFRPGVGGSGWYSLSFHNLIGEEIGLRCCHSMQS